MFFFLIFFSFFRKEAQDLGLGLSLSLSTSSTGTHGFSPQQLKHVHTTTYDLFHCIIVKVWQQPSSCSSLIFFPGPPTTEWDPPSLWVLHSFFFHNLDFITRRPLSLALSPGSLCLYLCHQEVLFNLIVCAVYLAASSLLATSVYMQVVNITSYIIRCQAMSVFLPWKTLFPVALLLPGPPWILSLSRSYCRLRELIFNWKRCWKTYFVVLLAMSKF